MEPATRTALERLARCLDEQLSALRHVSFKFEVQEVVLSSGRQRWLREATGELERAVQRLQESDVALRTALARAARAVELSPESTVREVAAAVPEPWGYVFEQRREELRRIIEQVGQLSRTNARLLAAGHAATVAAMSFLGVDVPTGYDAGGGMVPLSGSVGLLDARA